VSPHGPDPTRVLVLIKGLGIGGAETLIAQSARHWNRDEFHYKVAYMLPWKDQLVHVLEADRVEVECLHWKGPMSLAAMQRMRRLVRGWKPDIIHSHLPAAGLLARSSVPSARHVYTEHNIVTSYRAVTRFLNRASYGSNRAVIAVSGAVAESLTGYPGPKPRVIPNGVSVDVSDRQIKEARADLGLRPDDPLVVHVGNIRPHKGHSTLIEATTSLLSRVPDVHVISIGGEKNPGDLRRVRDQARELGLSDRMRFLGRIDDARPFIAAADVVVNPADVEGLPVTLLEALALGRPVVATAVGGVPSIIKHEETGLLVPPASPIELADALHRALTSPSAREWGLEGCRLVAQQFALESMVSSYESLYRDVIRG